MTTQFKAFTDASPLAVGTTLQASILDCLVLAQGCIVQGGVPVLSGSLTLAQPATVAVVNTGTSGGSPIPTSISLTFAASRDTYVDLDTAGVYHQPNVANNAAAPTLTANSVRLYKAVANGSAVTAIQQIAPNAPLPPTGISAASETGSSTPLGPTSTLADNIARIWQVLGPITGLTQTTIGVDSTEADTDDSLAGGSLLSNMDRIRYAWATALGLPSWQTQVMVNTKEVILSDGTNSASPALAGVVTTPTVPTATANRGVLSAGPSPFSGSGAGHFVGRATGTELAVNGPSSYNGDLLDLQVAGQARFRVTSRGELIGGLGTFPTMQPTFFVTLPFTQAALVPGATDQCGQVFIQTTNANVTLTAGNIIGMGFIQSSQLPSSRAPKAILVQPADSNQFWQYGQLNYQPANNACFVGFLILRTSPTFTCFNVTYSYQIFW